MSPRLGVGSWPLLGSGRQFKSHVNNLQGVGPQREGKEDGDQETGKNVMRCPPSKLQPRWVADGSCSCHVASSITQHLPRRSSHTVSPPLSHASCMQKYVRDVVRDASKFAKDTEHVASSMGAALTPRVAVRPASYSRAPPILSHCTPLLAWRTSRLLPEWRAVFLNRMHQLLSDAAAAFPRATGRTGPS